jgi:hypothetical protein
MLAVTGFVLGVGGLVFLLLAVLGVGRFNPTSSPLRQSDAEFDIGDAEARAAAIERDRTPLLFQDPARFVDPIWVNHVGDDPDSGWFAFAAADGDCEIVWEVDAQEFVDCDGERYPPDGQGLPQYEVRVEDGNVVVDLETDTTTTGPTIPESGE